MSTHGFIGDLLIRSGLVDAAGLKRALDTQSTQRRSLGRALSELGLVDEATVATTIASALRLDCLAGDPPKVSESVAALLPADFCRKRRLVPLDLNRNLLRLAVADPTDYSVFQDVEFKTSKKTIAVVVTETWLERALTAVYPEPGAGSPYSMLENAGPTGEVEAANDGEFELDPEMVARDTNLPPIVRLVNMLLSEAAKSGASDVHVEPQESGLQVRHRIDGLLREVLTIPQHLRDQTISRLKIISGMDIAERRKPQDGRSRLRFEGRRIDLRVSTLPTQFGEKVVIRLLNPDRAILSLDELGFTAENLRLMRSFVTRAQGMVLVTGPTGSGKTSTLYSLVNTVKSPTTNIITLEDPIEFQVPGVNQMQVNARAGVTFASGLRSILRQDPNVILVGEIRDQETADIALQAAQTGHLLLSTLHTNDATATITRLFDLGIQPFLAASSLIGIVAQRLVRRPCPSCAVPQSPSAAILDKVGGASRIPADARWLEGPGCERCAQTGTKGRLAIHEIVHITDEVRDLISNRAPEHVIRRAAKRAGMRSLREDGIAKAAQGLTTLDEVLRVVSDEEPQEGSPVSVAVGEAATAGDAVASADAAATVEHVAPMEPLVAPDVVKVQGPTPFPVSAPPPIADVAEPRPVTSQRRVLVVEDSPTIVSVVKYFLELEGFEVFVAGEGRSGLEIARRENPDVIVSDVNMPGMGGVEMVRELRGDSRTSHMRILMLTSEASVEAETEGLAAGADDYILKPVEPRRLAARVRALLARARPSRVA
jgi:type IV pilus assembly protein PilB